MSAKGLDVSPASSFLVEVSSTGLGYEISRAAILGGLAHTPGQPVGDAARSDLAKAAKETPSALRKGNLLASLPSHEAMLKISDAPSSSPSAIGAIARMEVRDATGAESGYLFATQFFSNQIANSPKIAISICREAMVEHYTAALSHANFRVDGLVAPALALYHCYLVSGEFVTDGPQMVAHIGEASTEIIVVDGADLLSLRSISNGVRDMVDAVATGVGVNTEQAREMVLRTINIAPGHAHENPSGEGVVHHGQDAVSRLFLQMRAVEGFTKAVTGRLSLKIDRIALCGPGALMQGLPKFLGHRYQKEVTIFNPLAGFQFGEMGSHERGLVGQHGIALGIALGLAKIAADHQRMLPIITPPSVVARQHFMQRALWLYAACILTVLALGVSYWLSSQQSAKAKEELKTAQTQSSRYAQAHDRIKVRDETFADVSVFEQFNGLSDLQQEDVTVSQQVRELSNAVAASNPARHFLARLPQALLTTLEIERFVLNEQVQAERGVMQAELVLTTNEIAQADAQIEEMLKRLRAFAFVGAVRSLETERQLDGRSGHLRFQIDFAAPSVGILGPDDEPAETEGA